MEMVAAARLRRAEQRIDALRPYARELRKMTRQVAEAAGVEARNLPVLQEHEEQKTVGILLVTGDRGLAGSFNSQIIRAGAQLQRELSREGKEVRFSVVGRRGVSTMRFRGEELHGEYVGFTDRPAFANAREIADDADRLLRRQGPEPGRPDLQPLRLAAHPVRAPADAAPGPAGRRLRRGGGGAHPR